MWKKTNHPTEKWGQDRNKTKKANGETEMVNKHKKRGLTSSLIKEMQIKQPQRFHFTPRRLEGLKLLSVGEDVGKYELSDITIWQYLQKLEICILNGQ